MARLRYTFSEARSEARRLAEQFVSQNPDRSDVVFVRVAPSHVGAKKAAAKVPIWWTACFTFPPPPHIVVDGGELMLDVNIETKDIHPWEEW